MNGKRLKELRKEKRVTQSALANFLNVDLTLVGKWELHGVTPNSETLNKLANFFGVTTDYLLGRSGDEKEQPNELFGEINKEEVDMLLKYRTLSEQQKKLINAYMDGVIAGM